LYKVNFPSPSIERKFFKELHSVHPKVLQKAILNTAISLANDPRPAGGLKIRPPIEIFDYLAQYRVRVDNWRIFYDVDDSAKKVWLLALRKRNERTYK
jgi:mRNA-degrading endonuclease RelE of RelBE toxin-antitoxin system